MDTGVLFFSFGIMIFVTAIIILMSELKEKKYIALLVPIMLSVMIFILILFKPYNNNVSIINEKKKA